MKAVALLAFVFLLTACNAGPHVVVHEVEDPTPAAQRAAPAANWEYKTEGNTSWACAHSTDNAAELCFRRVQGHLDSYLHLPREGHPFFCSRNHCETKIQIDAASVQTLEGTDDSAGGARILFLPAPERLLSQVEHAKEVRVSPPMFGLDQQFVFHVDGLKWP